MKFKKKTKRKISNFIEQKHFLKKLLTNEEELFKRETGYLIKGQNDIFDIDYKLNQFGFRCNEFNNQNIMFLGCSITYGEGLPEEYRWTNILANKMKTDFINLSKNGDSATGQVRKAFWYFKNFGHPKAIVALFPLGRIPFPMVPNKNVSSTKLNNIKKMGESQEDYKLRYYIDNLNMSGKEIESVSKIPYDLSKIIALEGVIYHSNIAIELLIQYCNSHDIKIFWSTWEGTLEKMDIIEQIYKEKYDSYVEIPATKWALFEYGDNPRWSHPLMCHEKYRSDKLFNQAADRKNDNFAHNGLHRHIHIAEEFFNAIKNKTGFGNDN